MGATIAGGTNRKEQGRSETLNATGLPEAVGLMDAIITVQRLREQGMPAEAKIFEDIVQRYRALFFRDGLDPDAVIKARAELLTRALQEKV